MNLSRSIFCVLVVASAFFGVACHTHSSASFSFDASFGFVDAGSPTGVDAGELDASRSALITSVTDFHLRVEKTGCFGTCATYVLVVDNLGHMDLSAHKYVDGAWSDQCGSKTLDPFVPIDLGSYLQKMGFFTLKNEYLGGPDGKPALVIELMLDGKTKTVRHVLDAKVGADAARLEAIENQIDEKTGDKHWLDPLTPLSPCQLDPTKPNGRSERP